MNILSRDLKKNVFGQDAGSYGSVVINIKYLKGSKITTVIIITRVAIVEYLSCAAHYPRCFDSEFEDQHLSSIQYWKCI